MKIVDRHQASEQMLGYLYQVRYALILLLKAKNERYQISIEKYDDVAFSDDEDPKLMIQLKHHIGKQGSLSDASTDLWRTLKVWIDACGSNGRLLNDTDFLLVTTAISPEGSATAFLKRDNRDVDSAYNLLKQVATTSSNQAHGDYYSSFISLGEDGAKKLLRKIYVVDGASNIVDASSEIHKAVRYACIPKFEQQICDRIEGWWYRQAITALCSEDPVYISQQQLRSVIVTISQQYADDNLPIDEIDSRDPNNENNYTEEAVFRKQLEWIGIGTHGMRSASRDYYKAFSHRSSWIRNEVLFLRELEEYESRLIDEWEHQFGFMEDTVSSLGESISEDKKAEEGRLLYRNIGDKDIKIRPRVDAPFVMRGSYHILSDQKRIGWHIDFKEKLDGLTTSQEASDDETME